MINVDVIILSNTKTLEHYGMTQRTISSLKWSESEINFNIIIVESNKKLLDFGYIYNDCKVIIPDETFGYNKFLNHGLKECKNDWIVIANNDLIFTQNWLTKMFTFQSEHADILSMSPWEPNWHTKRGLDSNNKVYYGHRTSFEITGWCLVIHKCIVDKCKLFDPNFEFWYQDDDYALTLQKYKFNHALIVNSRVYHMVNGSHRLLEERKHEMTDGQLSVLVNKWGNV